MKVDEGHLIFISIHWFSCITIESKSYSAEKKKNSESKSSYIKQKYATWVGTKTKITCEELKT